MSKENKVTENTEKVKTKYDLKMERRRLEQEKEAKARKRMKIGGIAILVVVIALIAGSIVSSLVRRQTTLQGTYIKIGDYEITKLEYDYYYNSVTNNYVTTYASLLGYMGLDTTIDYAEQAYSETMSWKDFFDQMTVAQIQEVKALKTDAEATGFTYEEAEEYENFKTNLATAAESAGISKSAYYKEMYGDYATEKRVEHLVKETLLAGAYYTKLTEDNAPAQEEIDTYYAEHKNNYDTVDYRSFTFENADVTEESEEDVRKSTVAKLQKSANEFADRLEAGEDFNALSAEYTEDEEEKASYESAEEDHSLSEGVSYSSANYVYSDWLFAEEREAGEIEVIPDEANARCYVLVFEGRNKDEESVNESISSSLASQAVGEYVDALVENYPVTDVKGDLKYLVIQAAAEASEEASENDTSNEEEAEDGTAETDVSEDEASNEDMSSEAVTE